MYKFRHSLGMDSTSQSTILLHLSIGCFTFVAWFYSNNAINMKYYLLLLGLILFSCKSQQVVVEEPILDEIYVPDTDEYTEERTLEELEVVASRGFKLPTYHPAAQREFDIIHTDLEIRFDWVNEHVLGRATITTKPYFYSQQFLLLDAKGMEIQSITTEDITPLTFQYNDRQIDIDLGRIYNKDETVTVIIDYIAKPSEGEEGGSAAITSDRGLFFINADGKEANKPQQIWTQGETENNSRWFPTIDKPNERMTQTLKVTVENKFKTLSNGTLDRSVQNADGTRTDHWNMNDPHAPYLVMLAVGEFAIVTEQWRDIELAYYVEQAYESDAKKIFAHTSEMLEFFSTILDYPYPWDKFSQIIVRDYVSGAMENTTAIVYGDFIQKTSRELIDDDNDYIIAHEMFHHWFGDLVTCESWSNLTLQEGFANYSEYLWEEYKYGADDADYHRANERSGYLSSIFQSGIHPLIHYGYENKEDMFDGHSYNKGGLVLHMLRHTIGDTAFFAGLNKYLNDNKYTAVEVDELRMAFEDVTGLDLNWFFDQWYNTAGHPELSLSYNYNEVSNEIVIDITQTQDPESTLPIFQIPVTIGVHDVKGIESAFEIIVTEREQQVRLDYPSKPDVIIFDKNDRLLFVKEEKKTTLEYIHQYKWSKVYAHRMEAITKLGNKSIGQPTMIEALTDPHFSIRVEAIQNINTKDNPRVIEHIKKLTTSDPHSLVRSAALKKLQFLPSIDHKELINHILAKEQSYNVIATAIKILNKKDPEAALIQATKFKGAKTASLISSISSILAASGDGAHLPYFENKLTSINLFSVFNFYDAYYELLSVQPSAIQVKKAKILRDIATNSDQNIFYKYTSASTINKMQKELVISDTNAAEIMKTMIEEIKSQETNEILLQRYSEF